jgi:hypothetical protein
MRMLSDPWLFIWHTHLFLTFVHFITWQVRAAVRRQSGGSPAAVRGWPARGGAEEPTQRGRRGRPCPPTRQLIFHPHF